MQWCVCRSCYRLKPMRPVQCREATIMGPGAGDYAYSSTCAGGVSGSSCPSSGRWRGWCEALSSRCLRRSRRCSRDTGAGVGVRGLMLSTVSIGACLSSLILTVYIGSYANSLYKTAEGGRVKIHNLAIVGVVMRESACYYWAGLTGEGNHA